MAKRNLKQKNNNEEQLESKLIDLARTIRVTGGGKHLSFRAAVVVGDKRGKVGFGIGKSKDTTEAIEKAFKQAKKNMFPVVIKDETIPHKVYAKHDAAEVYLFPQRKGIGIVAGGVVRVICNFAGIKNVSSKIIGRTKNKISNALATIKALKKLKPIVTKENKEDIKNEESAQSN